MLDKTLDTLKFQTVLKNEKALNPLRLKASEMAPPVGLEPTTLRLTAGAAVCGRVDGLGQQVK